MADLEGQQDHPLHFKLVEALEVLRENEVVLYELEDRNKIYCVVDALTSVIESYQELFTIVNSRPLLLNAAKEEQKLILRGGTLEQFMEKFPQYSTQDHINARDNIQQIIMRLIKNTKDFVQIASKPLHPMIEFCGNRSTGMFGADVVHFYRVACDLRPVFNWPDVNN